MKRLADTPLLAAQRDFLAFLHDAPNEFAACVAEGGRIDPERRLAIYHHAFRARLLEVMQDVFERTWAYLGDDAFAASVNSFITDHPPAERTLNRFGAQFPSWLSQRFPRDRDIAEVATLDWMLRCAFDGADCPPLQIDTLAALDAEAWSSAGFEFHPTLSVAPVTHNAASIWEALENGAAPPAAAALPTPAFLLVWRKQFQPHFITIDAVEAEAIAMLRDGLSFATTCATLEAHHPGCEISQFIGGALRRWVDEEMLVRVTRT
jgi:hypothetical protein